MAKQSLPTIIVIIALVVTLFYLVKPTTQSFYTQDCKFVTNKQDESYVGGDWISVDRFGGTTLIGYGYSIVTTVSSTPPSSDFLTGTPQGNKVYKCGTSNNVCLLTSASGFTQGYRFDDRANGASVAELTCTGTPPVIPPSGSQVVFRTNVVSGA